MPKSLHQIHVTKNVRIASLRNCKEPNSHLPFIRRNLNNFCHMNLAETFGHLEIEPATFSLQRWYLINLDYVAIQCTIFLFLCNLGVQKKKYLILKISWYIWRSFEGCGTVVWDWDVHFISTWQRFLFLLVSGIYKNKQTINQMKKECSFRKHFAQSSALPAQPGCTVCRHSAFLDDKKHIPFHHNRPYLLKQSVQACRKNLPQNGTCSIYSIALKVFVWMYVHMVIWVRG